MNIKRGLLRVWMVVSVFWLLAMFGLYGFSFNQFYPQKHTEQECISKLSLEREKDKNLTELERLGIDVDDIKTCMGEGSSRYLENRRNYLMWSLIPILGFLAGGFLISWVIKGFKKDNEHD